jgi:anti-sigma-K factor RskA
VTTEEYMTSGILEVYACGGLSAEEATEVRTKLQLYPELRDELDRIEAALENYARLYAAFPPAGLKYNIREQQNGATPLAAETVGKTKPKVVPISAAKTPTKVARNYAWLAAAGVVLFLISAGLNIYFYFGWKKAEGSLAIALAQKATYADNFRQAKLELKNSETAFQVLENPETKHITLQGSDKAPQAKALVHWNPKTKKVVLDIKKLPEAPAGHQYQLWALHNGIPINAGMINPTDTIIGFQEMQTISEAVAFAFTLEWAGGSINPTLTEMYLIGKM